MLKTTIKIVEIAAEQKRPVKMLRMAGVPIKAVEGVSFILIEFL
jgi:hypothetical protein